MPLSSSRADLVRQLGSEDAVRRDAGADPVEENDQLQRNLQAFL